VWLGLIGLPLGEQLNSFGEGCAYEELSEADQAPTQHSSLSQRSKPSLLAEKEK
jgi:hypothetical protein